MMSFFREHEKGPSVGNGVERREGDYDKDNWKETEQVDDDSGAVVSVASEVTD